MSQDSYVFSMYQRRSFECPLSFVSDCGAFWLLGLQADNKGSRGNTLWRFSRRSTKCHGGIVSGSNGPARGTTKSQSNLDLLKLSSRLASDQVIFLMWSQPGSHIPDECQPCSPQCPQSCCSLRLQLSRPIGTLERRESTAIARCICSGTWHRRATQLPF